MKNSNNYNGDFLEFSDGKKFSYAPTEEDVLRASSEENKFLYAPKELDEELWNKQEDEFFLPKVSEDGPWNKQEDEFFLPEVSEDGPWNKQEDEFFLPEVSEDGPWNKQEDEFFLPEVSEDGPWNKQGESYGLTDEEKKNKSTNGSGNNSDDSQGMELSLDGMTVDELQELKAKISVELLSEDSPTLGEQSIGKSRGFGM